MQGMNKNVCDIPTTAFAKELVLDKAIKRSGKFANHNVDRVEMDFLQFEQKMKELSEMEAQNTHYVLPRFLLTLNHCDVYKKESEKRNPFRQYLRNPSLTADGKRDTFLNRDTDKISVEFNFNEDAYTLDCALLLYGNKNNKLAVSGCALSIDFAEAENMNIVVKRANLMRYNGVMAEATEEEYHVVARTAFQMAGMFILVQMLMDWYGDRVFEVEEKEIKEDGKKPTGSHKKPQKAAPVVRMYKCYTFKKSAEKRLPKPKIKRSITCDAWGVRGHMRHYKNGKTVFVRAYTKGKNRQNYQPKEYRIVPKI